MNHFSAGRWVRWLIIDHLMLIVLVLMLATVFGIPLVKSIVEHDQRNAPLLRSTVQRPTPAEQAIAPHPDSRDR
ncbi:hypothetical protein [Rhizobium binae]|uniref:ABC-type proline/glycine betaine transport system permease subunit n=1 Tax=Rhizobium binae TaxID=1138190 RepID=A0ABV2MHM1_9HYPH|nr:hypothetical protein [Rhizobium binae]NKL48539.1 hypothetical protein [Rhizobium leguminosarum bv. viciae]MBX4927898.1 hypothetical protein [Rhizobium binae]MBX4938444.1 hypothetical protein [Rhizobium binae]MBX4944951.1 hypothetical protein [Rhizobium binae]MBX4952132.1 hypothetical protein [Rhizobium binae]